MFGIKNLKLVKELKNIKPHLKWLQFSNTEQNNQKEFFESIVADNKFVKEDMKIRAMVKDIIRKEFGESIEKSKDYNFLVDSVVHKLKKQRLGKIEPLE